MTPDEAKLFRKLAPAAAMPAEHPAVLARLAGLKREVDDVMNDPNLSEADKMQAVLMLRAASRPLHPADPRQSPEPEADTPTVVEVRR